MAVSARETAAMKAVPVFRMLLARFGLPAPVSWPTRVAIPEPKLIMGRKMTESTRYEVVMAATVCSPKPFINCCRKNVAHRADAGLGRGRKPEPHAVSECGSVYDAPGKRKTKDGIPADGVNDNKDGHGGLGDSCGCRGAGGAEAQTRHKDQIQDEIYAGRNQHCQKGRPAVPKAPENRGVCIVIARNGIPVSRSRR